ncbi:ArnT family glycosyltransferase [Rhodovulum sp. DZ06]|uniref:ArnT family glycosyltransferase n=1 Tax=Rhodovulum sp. DZ06 TaxID=3425126 RepID=UPI003D34C2B2
MSDADKRDEEGAAQGPRLSRQEGGAAGADAAPAAPAEEAARPDGRGKARGNAEAPARAPLKAGRSAFGRLAAFADRVSAILHDALSAALDRAEASPVRAALLIVLVTLAVALPGLTILPPTDRDESRFVQASRQMLQSGDFIDIRFQDAPRWKKPAGIYWAQAGSVAGASALAGRDLSGEVWAYRIPSILGALAAGLGLAWGVAPLIGRRAAVLAGVMLPASALLAAEANIAKTDALLLGLSVLAMGAYFRLLALHRPEAGVVAQAESRRLSLLFWGLIGAGFLVKGPIVLIPAFGAALVLGVAERSLRPLGAMGWRWGPPLALLIAAPWYIAIGIQTDGAFFEEALLKDLLGKVVEGKESHGAPPGTYAAVFWAVFWPWAPLLLAILPALRRWREAPVLPLLAWAVPAWLVFEFTPTKLPHYVLPALPPVAALIAWGLEARPADPSAPRWRRILPAFLFGLVAAVLVVAAGIAPAAIQLWNGQDLDWAAALAGFALALVAAPLCLGAVRLLASGRYGRAAAPMLVSAVLLFAALLQFALPATRFGQPSVRMAGIAAPWTACLGAPPAATKYNEPSLVFLQGGDTAMFREADAAAYLAGGAGRLVWAVDGRMDAPLAEAGLEAQELARFTGFNLNGGKRQVHRLLAVAGDPAVEACRAVFAAQDEAREAAAPAAAR